MANYHLQWDDIRKFLVCRIVGFMPDTEVEAFAADFLRITKQTRREQNGLRLLFDNKNGAAFSPQAVAALANLQGHAMPGDRTAVVVAGSLNRLQANRAKDSDTELFDSEAEAVAWLTSRDVS